MMSFVHLFLSLFCSSVSLFIHPVIPFCLTVRGIEKIARIDFQEWIRDEPHWTWRIWSKLPAFGENMFWLLPRKQPAPSMHSEISVPMWEQTSRKWKQNLKFWITHHQKNWTCILHCLSVSEHLLEWKLQLTLNLTPFLLHCSVNLQKKKQSQILLIEKKSATTTPPPTFSPCRSTCQSSPICTALFERVDVSGRSHSDSWCWRTCLTVVH